MANYPINVYTDVLRDDVSKAHQKIDELASKCNWYELFEMLEEYTDLIDSTRLPVRNENKPVTLYTPLHYAASGDAPKDVFENLLAMGATKSLKTASGETAYDIAKSKGHGQDILELLKIPSEIKQNALEIEKMEKGLHSVINGRVEDLIKKNGQALPQLAYLYEKDSFYYPVPGMYGGFSINKMEDGIHADSWIRICGGSEQNHLIEKDGKVTLLPNDNPI